MTNLPTTLQYKEAAHCIKMLTVALNLYGLQDISFSGVWFAIFFNLKKYVQKKQEKLWVDWQCQTINQVSKSFSVHKNEFEISLKRSKAR